MEILKRSAIKTVYKDILSQLWQISNSNGNREEKNAKLESAVAVIKAQLDAYLVGTFSPSRYSMWWMFLNSIFQQESDCAVDLYSFLDCIIDSNFKTLNFFPIRLPNEAVATNGQFYLTKVVELLAKRSPDLNSLWIKLHQDWQLTSDMQIAYSKSFSGLKNLTVLHLSRLSMSDDCIPFFTHLGNSCPNLKSLQLIQQTQNIGMKQLLALVLGEEVDQFIQNFITEQEEPENNIHLLQFPDFIATSICGSLIKLEIFYNDQGSELDFSSKAHASAMAFLLRNMSNLETLEVSYSASPIIFSSSHLGVSRGIQLLHELSQGTSQPLISIQFLFKH